MANTCIFCETKDGYDSVEHIIPQSLGNIHYITPKGLVCSNCNNRFARIENKVVSSEVFIKERVRLGNVAREKELDARPLIKEDMAKFLLKMGYESIYFSRRKLWKEFDWDILRQYLIEGNFFDVEEFMSYDPPNKFMSIPRWLDKFRLRNRYLSLEYGINHRGIFVRFQYGRLRSTAWMAHPVINPT